MSLFNPFAKETIKMKVAQQLAEAESGLLDAEQAKDAVAAAISQAVLPRLAPR